MFQERIVGESYDLYNSGFGTVDKCVRHVINSISDYHEIAQLAAISDLSKEEIIESAVFQVNELIKTRSYERLRSYLVYTLEKPNFQIGSFLKISNSDKYKIADFGTDFSQELLENTADRTYSYIVLTDRYLIVKAIIPIKDFYK